ncbi:MAG: SBBP repeat-containing protein [Acidobacteria bacterium]|nr:SBBP repeat-containing protein [Acidobacteriota bacterium]
MRRDSWTCRTVLGVSMTIIAACGGDGDAAEPAATSRVAARYGSLPLRFEANQGQLDPRVKFASRGEGYTVFLTPTEVALTFERHRPRAVVRMRLTGANPNPAVTPSDRLPGSSNYFIGNDPMRWRTGVAGYASVRLEEVYRGIDVVYYGNRRQLEFDFVVAPGADPRAVRLALEGADDLVIDGDGDLVARLNGDEIVRIRRPAIYQPGPGKEDRRLVEGRYVLDGGRQVGFDIAAYDATKPLIIDPVVVYSTYLGGSNTDEPGIVFGSGRTIAVDADGHAYITGHTSSLDFPTTPGAQGRGGFRDAFVTKLAADGSSAVYSTYLGGAGEDWANGLAVDAAGHAYVTGYTESGDFPFTLVQSGGGSIFVTKLDPAGTALVYSRQFGAPGDAANAIAVDEAGSAYITGVTYNNQNGFPVTDSAPQRTCAACIPFRDQFRDAFVTKLDPDGGALAYSSFLGGTGADVGLNLAVDPEGNAVVTGFTSSADFPTASALQEVAGGGHDAFVTKINAAGTAWLYSTYLGGSADENRIAGIGPPAAAVAVDAGGSAYLTGFTTSPNFPTSAGALQTALLGGWDAFVTKLGPGGAGIYSTFLGGASQDSGYGIAVKGSGRAHVTGGTNSDDFPTAGALQSSRSGNEDVFVATLDADGSAVQFSTYWGGTGGDVGRSIALDGSGGVHVVGQTIAAGFPPDPVTNDFPTTPGAYQETSPGDMDVFVLKLGEEMGEEPVETPAEMTSDLLAETTAAGVRQARGLLDAVIRRGAAAGSRDPSSCNQLAAFINQVRAQTGRQVPPAQAATWIAAAGLIRATLGCL